MRHHSIYKCQQTKIQYLHLIRIESHNPQNQLLLLQDCPNTKHHHLVDEAANQAKKRMTSPALL